MWYLVLIFSAAFVLPALAGLGSLLKSEEVLTRRKILASIFMSGFGGLGVFLMWYSRFQEDIHFLLAVALVLGLAGVKGTEFLTALVKKMIIGFAAVKVEENKPETEKK